VKGEKTLSTVPVLYIIGRTLPEAWQKAVVALFEQGADIPTAYDRAGDPPSKEATTQILIEEPFAEPRIHRRAIPGGLEELEIYRLEVVAGVHDHWIDRKGEQWNYTYHERLRSYESPQGRRVDQIEEMIDLICSSEFPFGRRFQVITWMPWIDPRIIDPPCLQRLHFRLVSASAGVPSDTPSESSTLNSQLGSWRLNMSADWRSRDAYKAWFMNAFALTDLQRLVAQEISARKGVKVEVGRYVDRCDSLHIYGKDLEGVGGFKGFMEALQSKSLQELCWNSQFARPIFMEARQRLAAQLHAEQDGLGKGVIPPGTDLSSVPYPKEWDM
jgi:thymidylate synthase